MTNSLNRDLNIGELVVVQGFGPIQDRSATILGGGGRWKKFFSVSLRVRWLSTGVEEEISALRLSAKYTAIAQSEALNREAEASQYRYQLLGEARAIALLCQAVIEEYRDSLPDSVLELDPLIERIKKFLEVEL